MDFRFEPQWANYPTALQSQHMFPGKGEYWDSKTVDGPIKENVDGRCLFIFGVFRLIPSWIYFVGFWRWVICQTKQEFEWDNDDQHPLCVFVMKNVFLYPSSRISSFQPFRESSLEYLFLPSLITEFKGSTLRYTWQEYWPRNSNWNTPKQHFSFQC